MPTETAIQIAARAAELKLLPVAVPSINIDGQPYRILSDNGGKSAIFPTAAEDAVNRLAKLGTMHSSNASDGILEFIDAEDGSHRVARNTQANIDALKAANYTMSKTPLAFAVPANAPTRAVLDGYPATDFFTLASIESPTAKHFAECAIQRKLQPLSIACIDMDGQEYKVSLKGTEIKKYPTVDQDAAKRLTQVGQYSAAAEVLELIGPDGHLYIADNTKANRTAIEAAGYTRATAPLAFASPTHTDTSLYPAGEAGRKFQALWLAPAQPIAEIAPVATPSPPPPPEQVRATRPPPAAPSAATKPQTSSVKAEPPYIPCVHLETKFEGSFITIRQAVEGKTLSGRFLDSLHIENGLSNNFTRRTNLEGGVEYVFKPSPHEAKRFSGVSDTSVTSTLAADGSIDTRITLRSNEVNIFTTSEGGAKSHSQRFSYAMGNAGEAYLQIVTAAPTKENPTPKPHIMCQPENTSFPIPVSLDAPTIAAIETHLSSKGRFTAQDFLKPEVFARNTPGNELKMPDLIRAASLNPQTQFQAAAGFALEAAARSPDNTRLEKLAHGTSLTESITSALKAAMPATPAPKSPVVFPIGAAHGHDGIRINKDTGQPLPGQRPQPLAAIRTQQAQAPLFNHPPFEFPADNKPPQKTYTPEQLKAAGLKHNRENSPDGTTYDMRKWVEIDPDNKQTDTAALRQLITDIDALAKKTGLPRPELILVSGAKDIMLPGYNEIYVDKDRVAEHSPAVLKLLAAKTIAHMERGDIFHQLTPRNLFTYEAQVKSYERAVELTGDPQAFQQYREKRHQQFAETLQTRFGDILMDPQKILADEASPSARALRQLTQDVAEIAAKAGRPAPKIQILDKRYLLSGETPMTSSHDSIYVCEEALRKMDAKTLKAIAGHEYSHVAFEDMFLKTDTHQQEVRADTLSSKWTGEPQALLDYFIQSSRTAVTKQKLLKTVGMSHALGATIDALRDDSFTHPSYKSRIHRLRAMVFEQQKTEQPLPLQPETAAPQTAKPALPQPPTYLGPREHGMRGDSQDRGGNPIATRPGEKSLEERMFDRKPLIAALPNDLKASGLGIIIDRTNPEKPIATLTHKHGYVPPAGTQEAADKLVAALLNVEKKSGVTHYNLINISGASSKITLDKSYEQPRLRIGYRFVEGVKDITPAELESRFLEHANAPAPVIATEPEIPLLQVSEYNHYSRRMRAIMADMPKGPGGAEPYMDIKKLFDRIAGDKERFGATEDRKIMAEVQQMLEKHGIRRAALFGSGAASVVLQTVDNKGRMQLVTFTPSHHKPLHHPADVPDIESRTIGDTDIRISVALKREGITTEDAKILAKLYRDSGLNPWDLESTNGKSNVLVYETPEGKRLLFRADRDAVSWPDNITPAEKQAQIAKWATDPALKDHREVREQLRQGGIVGNTFNEDLTRSITRQALSAGDPTSQTTLETAIAKLGMYPVELERVIQSAEAAYAQAVKQKGDAGAAWVEALRKGVADFNPALSPQTSQVAPPEKTPSTASAPADKGSPFSEQGLKPSALAVTHATAHMPKINTDGSVEITTTHMHNANAYPRNTAHFALNHKVSGHMLGDWAAAPITIIGPFDKMILPPEKGGNGPPAALLTQDTFWTGGLGKPIIVPDATLVLPGPVKDGVFTISGKHTHYKTTGFSESDIAQIYKALGRCDREHLDADLKKCAGDKAAIEKILAQCASKVAVEATLDHLGYTVHEAGKDGWLKFHEVYDHRHLNGSMSIDARDRGKPSYDQQLREGVDALARKLGAENGLHSSTTNGHLEDLAANVGKALDFMEGVKRNPAALSRNSGTHFIPAPEGKAREWHMSNDDYWRIVDGKAAETPYFTEQFKQIDALLANADDKTREVYRDWREKLQPRIHEVEAYVKQERAALLLPIPKAPPTVVRNSEKALPEPTQTLSELIARPDIVIKISSEVLIPLTVALPEEVTRISKSHHSGEILLHAAIQSADEKTPELLKLRKIAETQQKGTIMLEFGMKKPAIYDVFGPATAMGKNLQGNTVDLTGFKITAAAAEYGLDPAKLQGELTAALQKATGKAPQTIAGALPDITTKRGPSVPAHIIAYEQAEITPIITKLAASENPAIREPFDRVRKMQQLEAALQQDPAFKNNYTRSMAATWAVALNGPQTTGEYFDVKSLAPNLAALPLNAKLDAKTMAQVEAALHKEGIRRVSYFGHGDHSIVFATLPDAQGNMRLVTITPKSETSIPHPAGVPDIKTIPVGEMEVRVSVALKRDIATEAETKKLMATLKASGLEPADFTRGDYVKNNNTLIYEIDGKRLPYFADRGAVLWPEGTTEAQKQTQIKQWATDPALADYRAAHAQMKATGQGPLTFAPETIRAVTHQALPKRKATPDSSLKTALVDKGMYPVELERITTEATRVAEAGGDWLQAFREGVKKFDPTIAPTTDQAPKDTPIVPLPAFTDTDMANLTRLAKANPNLLEAAGVTPKQILELSTAPTTELFASLNADRLKPLMHQVAKANAPKAPAGNGVGTLGNILLLHTAHDLIFNWDEIKKDPLRASESVAGLAGGVGGSITPLLQAAAAKDPLSGKAIGNLARLSKLADGAFTLTSPLMIKGGLEEFSQASTRESNIVATKDIISGTAHTVVGVEALVNGAGRMAGREAAIIGLKRLAPAVLMYDAGMLGGRGVMHVADAFGIIKLGPNDTTNLWDNIEKIQVMRKEAEARRVETYTAGRNDKFFVVMEEVAKPLDYKHLEDALIITGSWHRFGVEKAVKAIVANPREAFNPHTIIEGKTLLEHMQPLAKERGDTYDAARKAYKDSTLGYYKKGMQESEYEGLTLRAGVAELIEYTARYDAMQKLAKENPAELKFKKAFATAAEHMDSVADTRQKFLDQEPALRDMLKTDPTLLEDITSARAFRLAHAQDLSKWLHEQTAREKAWREKPGSMYGKLTDAQYRQEARKRIQFDYKPRVPDALYTKQVEMTSARMKAEIQQIAQKLDTPDKHSDPALESDRRKAILEAHFAQNLKKAETLGFHLVEGETDIAKSSMAKNLFITDWNKLSVAVQCCRDEAGQPLNLGSAFSIITRTEQISGGIVKASGSKPTGEAWADLEYVAPKTGEKVTRRVVYKSEGETTKILAFFDPAKPETEKTLPAWATPNFPGLASSKPGALPLGVTSEAFTAILLKAEHDSHNVPEYDAQRLAHCHKVIKQFGGEFMAKNMEGIKKVTSDSNEFGTVLNVHAEDDKQGKYTFVATYDAKAKNYIFDRILYTSTDGKQRTLPYKDQEGNGIPLTSGGHPELHIQLFNMIPDARNIITYHKPEIEKTMAAEKQADDHAKFNDKMKQLAPALESGSIRDIKDQTTRREFNIQLRNQRLDTYAHHLESMSSINSEAIKISPIDAGTGRISIEFQAKTRVLGNGKGVETDADPKVETELKKLRLKSSIHYLDALRNDHSEHKFLTAMLNDIYFIAPSIHINVDTANSYDFWKDKPPYTYQQNNKLNFDPKDEAQLTIIKRILPAAEFTKIVAILPKEDKAFLKEFHAYNLTEFGSAWAAKNIPGIEGIATADAENGKVLHVHMRDSDQGNYSLVATYDPMKVAYVFDHLYYTDDKGAHHKLDLKQPAATERERHPFFKDILSQKLIPQAREAIKAFKSAAKIPAAVKDKATAAVKAAQEGSLAMLAMSTDAQELDGALQELSLSTTAEGHAAFALLLEQRDKVKTTAVNTATPVPEHLKASIAKFEKGEGETTGLNYKPKDKDKNNDLSV